MAEIQNAKPTIKRFTKKYRLLIHNENYIINRLVSSYSNLHVLLLFTLGNKLQILKEITYSVACWSFGMYAVSCMLHFMHLHKHDKYYMHESSRKYCMLYGMLVSGELLHIKFSLHVLGTQHVINTADEMSRKLSLKL